MYGKGLRALSLATFAALTATFALVFFYAPLDADQGFIQKIFYVHVPVAIVTLCAYVVGGVFAALHLRTRDRKWDLRSYVVIHIALIFNILGLLTGAIWAKASWGHWWVWDSPTLASFLIVFLLFATYQPLRFSIEDPERQARYASRLRHDGGRVRAAQLRRRARGDGVPCIRACRRRRRRPARRRWRGCSSSRSSR